MGRDESRDQGPTLPKEDHAVGVRVGRDPAAARVCIRQPTAPRRHFQKSPQESAPASAAAASRAKATRVFAIVPPSLSPRSYQLRASIEQESPPLRTVHLRRSPSPPDAAPESAAIAVDGGGGVDLARVGRALGLDPASVRLNGYFVSRGPGHVSTAVTWGALLAFFAARGLPTGADHAAPVAVRGRPAPSPPRPDPGVLQSSKRKSGLETESCSKKSKLQHNSSTLSKSSEELLSDEITLGLKRRLRLDDMTPSKRIKQVDYTPETQQPVKFSCSFINGHGKRPRDEEMVTSLPCKRVR